jgi:hypothetical protein
VLDPYISVNITVRLNGVQTVAVLVFTSNIDTTPMCLTT